MAQDWSTAFPPGDTTETIMGPTGPIDVQVPCKDPLTIEIMDCVGVCLASIKDLYNKINTLQQQVNTLQQTVNSLQP